MADPVAAPSIVFPLPGYTGAIAPHGAPENTGGSDIFAPYGSTVLNMIDGKVTFVGVAGQGSGRFGGNSIEVRGADGKDYYYAHLLNNIPFQVGQTIAAGAKLGQVDNTGNAATTQAHLHIGIGIPTPANGNDGIVPGSGPTAGIGHNFNAVAMLQSLEKSGTANNPVFGTNDATAAPPPPINFVPAIPGFDSAHASDIQTNLDAALAAGIDPFVWLAIVAHESNFVDGVVNPKSGACGYAQLYPCQSGAQTGSANASAGLAKLTAFLQQCHGDLTCALDNHYSGGIPGYAALIQSWANQIEQANPELKKAIDSGTYKGGSGTGSVDVSGGGGASSGGSDSTAQCPPIPINIGPTTVYFPDVGCMVTMSVKQLTTSLTNWWKDWQTTHVSAWLFAGIGIVFVIVGLAIVAQQSGTMDKVGSLAAKATPETAVAAKAAGAA